MPSVNTALNTILFTTPKIESTTSNVVTSLVDKSQLHQTSTADGAPRFSMLETIRAYAFDRLSASEERAAAHRRHPLLFLALAEAAEPQIQGPDQVARSSARTNMPRQPNMKCMTAYLPP